MDFKSLLIGFLSAACLFLLMAATKVDFVSQTGRFQIAVADDTFAILDTQSGRAKIMAKGRPMELRYAAE